MVLQGIQRLTEGLDTKLSVVSPLIDHFIRSTYHNGAVCRYKTSDVAQRCVAAQLVSPHYPIHQWKGTTV